MVVAPPSLGPDAAQSIRTIASLLRIAHHIPGRVRLKLDGQAAADLPQALDTAKTFVACVRGTAGIRAVDLNPLARSCVVEYDPLVIPAAAWEDLIGGRRSAAADSLVQTLSAVNR